MIYLQRAFKNGKQVFSKVVNTPTYSTLVEQSKFGHVGRPIDLIKRWNTSQISTAPIQWHYFLVEA